MTVQELEGDLVRRLREYIREPQVIITVVQFRSEPVFLTSRYIWYQGERDCVPADGCGTNPPFHPASGKTYIYDLQDGTETGSVITSVADVWPHAA